MSDSHAFHIATAQFAVTSDIDANAARIVAQIKQAKSLGAEMVLFPEAALSGYGGPDRAGFEPTDWDKLRRATGDICNACKASDIEAIVGSAHFIAEDEKPTNCMYVIGRDGNLVDRYDKRMLTMSDEFYYTAGDHHVILERQGHKLALQICYDICHPELYADLRRKGVQIVLHAFYNASFDTPNILDEVGPAWLRARAADNRMFIVASNASRAHQNWASCIVRPDGNICASLERNIEGVLVHHFPDDERSGWEHNYKEIRLADDEVFHRGATSAHARATDRKAPP